jgi:predicted  nucleic acid-binding Zn-ribbon protein
MRARVLLRGCRDCGCRRDRRNSERMKTLFFIEKQLGPEAVAGLSGARQMEHISSIMAHALGRKPE